MSTPGHWRRSVIGLGLLLASSLSAAPAGAQTDADIRSLIDKLDSNTFAERQQAEATLKAHITANRLTPAQLGIIRTYPENPPLELKQRKEAVLAEWTRSFPAVAKVLGSIQVRDIQSTDFDATFKIGEFDGLIPAPDQGDLKDLSDLQRRYEAARNALLAADTENVVDSLRKLKDFVADPNKLSVVIFTKGADEAKTADVVAALEQAITDAQEAIQAIKIGSNNVMPPPRQPKQIDGQGLIDVGKTLRLAFNAPPLVAGGLDIFMPSYDLTLYLPPPGYEFVGEVFDLLSTDTLEVTGQISIGIEYGEFQLFGNPVRDLSALRIARFSNGRVEILEDFFNDTTSFVLTGVYMPESASSGFNQFGEFVLIQPAIPEPATLLLLGCGAAAAAMWRRRRDGWTA